MYIYSIVLSSDILVGIPSLQAHNLDSRVHEERCRHLVAELLPSPDCEDSVLHLTNFVRKQLKRLHTEKLELTNEILLSKLTIPYQFITPKGKFRVRITLLSLRAEGTLK